MTSKWRDLNVLKSLSQVIRGLPDSHSVSLSCHISPKRDHITSSDCFEKKGPLLTVARLLVQHLSCWEHKIVQLHFTLKLVLLVSSAMTVSSFRLTSCWNKHTITKSYAPPYVLDSLQVFKVAGLAAVLNIVAVALLPSLKNTRSSEQPTDQKIKKITGSHLLTCAQ